MRRTRYVEHDEFPDLFFHGFSACGRLQASRIEPKRFRGVRKRGSHRLVGNCFFVSMMRQADTDQGPPKRRTIDNFTFFARSYFELSFWRAVRPSLGGVGLAAGGEPCRRGEASPRIYATHWLGYRAHSATSQRGAAEGGYALCRRALFAHCGFPKLYFRVLGALVL